MMVLATVVGMDLKHSSINFPKNDGIKDCCPCNWWKSSEFGFLYKRKGSESLDFMSLKVGLQHLSLCTNRLIYKVFRIVPKENLHQLCRNLRRDTYRIQESTNVTFYSVSHGNSIGFFKNHRTLKRNGQSLFGFLIELQILRKIYLEFNSLYSFHWKWLFFIIK
jgi:hypothetical protein